MMQSSDIPEVLNLFFLFLSINPDAHFRTSRSPCSGQHGSHMSSTSSCLQVVELAKRGRQRTCPQERPKRDRGWFAASWITLAPSHTRPRTQENADAVNL